MGEVRSSAEGIVWCRKLKIVRRRDLCGTKVLLTMTSLILNTKPKSTVEAPMIAFSNSLKFSAIALFGVTLGAHAAQAPQRIDVKQMSKKVENVVVPLPNEIFGALTKLGSVNCRQYVRTKTRRTFTNRSRIPFLHAT